VTADAGSIAPATRIGSSAPPPATVAAGLRRPRLHHVDYMRPFKQGVVITTHSLLLFAPAASATAGAALLVTHLGRFAFMFISAAMLVYAYPHLERGNFGHFWRRRLLAVAVPYALWTLFYFFWESVPGVSDMYRPTGGLTGSASTSLAHFGYLLVTGYYQLYFLVLLLEFYIVYPLFLWVLRRGAKRPWLLLASSAALQLGMACLLHWAPVPGWLSGFWGAREVWYYQLYLVAGGLVALYYQEVHAWLCRHWRLVLVASGVTLVSAEAWYWLADLKVVPILGGTNLADPFQPVVIPLFVSLIGAIYLLGVVVAHPRAPAWIRSAAHSGADNSFGIYLSQVLFLSIISMLGWGRLATSLSWPVVVIGAVIVVFLCSAALTSVLARLPAAKATSGRPRQRWRRPHASRPPQLVAGTVPAVSPAG
jgi:peptidoglycan/LPS O-acetylase OafA/YrhL